MQSSVHGLIDTLWRSQMGTGIAEAWVDIRESCWRHRASSCRADFRHQSYSGLTAKKGFAEMHDYSSLNQYIKVLRCD